MNTEMRRYSFTKRRHKTITNSMERTKSIQKLNIRKYIPLIRWSKALKSLCFLLYIVMPSLNKIPYHILSYSFVFSFF